MKHQPVGCWLVSLSRQRHLCGAEGAGVTFCTSPGRVPTRELSTFTKWKTSKCWFPGNSLHICIPCFPCSLLWSYVHTHPHADLSVNHCSIQKMLPCIETLIFHAKSMQILPTCTYLWLVISRASRGKPEARFTHMTSTFTPPTVLLYANTHLHTKTKRIKAHLSVGLQVELQLWFQRGDDGGRW